MYRFLRNLKCWFHKITVGRIIQYHVRGMYKVRIVSWWEGKEVIYFEGQLKDFRQLDWSIKKKVYKQRVYTVMAEDDFLVIQIAKERPELKRLIDIGFGAVSNNKGE